MNNPQNVLETLTKNTNRPKIKIEMNNLTVGLLVCNVFFVLALILAEASDYYYLKALHNKIEMLHSDIVNRRDY